MKPFDVYPLFDIEITRGEGCYTYDEIHPKWCTIRLVWACGPHQIEPSLSLVVQNRMRKDCV